MQQPNPEAGRLSPDFGPQTAESIYEGVTLQYQGMGSNFIVSAKDGGYQDAVLSLPVTLNPPSGDSSVTADFEQAEVPAHSLIVVHQAVSGGQAEDGTWYRGGLEDTNHTLLGLYQESLQESQAALDEYGLMPIFIPDLPNFDPQRPALARHEQNRKISDMLKTKLAVFDELAAVKEDSPQPEQDNEVQEIIDARAIVPVYEAIIDGKKVHTSGVLKDANDSRPYVAIYSSPDQIEPLIFYRSNSHGIWRALVATNEGKPNYYPKGIGAFENATDAPIALQEHLLKVSRAPHSPVSRRALRSLTQISAKDIESDTDAKGGFKALRVARKKLGNVGISETSGQHTFGANSGSERPVDELFLPEWAPDMDNVLKTWKDKLPGYGDVEVRVCPSVNGEVNYMVLSAEHEGIRQHWVATAELVGAPVTSLGLRQQFPIVSVEALQPPLINPRGESEKGLYSRMDAETLFGKYLLRQQQASKVGNS